MCSLPLCVNDNTGSRGYRSAKVKDHHFLDVIGLSRFLSLSFIFSFPVRVTHSDNGNTFPRFPSLPVFIPLL